MDEKKSSITEKSRAYTQSINTFLNTNIIEMKQYMAKMERKKASINRVPDHKDLTCQTYI